MNRLGIEMLSGIGLPPVEMAHLAADLGCAHISVGPNQMPARFNPLGYPDWSIITDAAYRRELADALRNRGVSISLGEGFAVRPGISMADRGAEMDIFAALGTRVLGAVCMEPDETRALDEFATLADMAHARGMIATIEFAPIQIVRTLEQALAIVHAVGQPHFRLLFDAMHFFRSGAKVADLAAIDPALIGYAQLCDVPMPPPHKDYLAEAMGERLVPGDGDLPLTAFVAALPADILLGLEVPMLGAAQAGVDARNRLRPAVTAAHAILEGAAAPC